MDMRDNVAGLVEEYRSLFANRANAKDKELVKILEHFADWTPKASEHLIALANNYGYFMLRNALAISIALDKEDGRIGF